MAFSESAFFSIVPGEGMTMTPGAVALIDALAEDLEAGRRLLRSLPRLTDPAAIRRSALELAAIAPTLAAPVRRLLSGASALPKAIDGLLDRYLEQPTSLRVSYALAQALCNEGLFSPALAFLLRFECLATAFGLPDAQRAMLDHEIGYCLTALGRHEEALARFTEAAREKGDFADYSCIAHTLVELGRMAEAREAFAQALTCASHPFEILQTAMFVTGADRLLEFEGQRGGLDARDLHYVQTGGLVLELAGEARDGIVQGSGYYGGLALGTADEVARLLLKLRCIVRALPAERRPTCVVPLHNAASPLSLAIAELLGVPHLSHRRVVPWDRPLVVATRLRAEDAADWDRFLERLPASTLSFVCVADWTAEELPAVDITGVLASSCRFFWENPDPDSEPPSNHKLARTLVNAVEEQQQSAARLGALEHYYQVHARHRLGG